MNLADLLRRLIGQATANSRWLANQENRMRHLEAELRAMRSEVELIREFERQRQW